MTNPATDARTLHEYVCDINNFVQCLTNGGLALIWANLISLLLGVVLVATLPLITVIMLIWVERKFAARVQDRLGPNRVGPFGLLQTVADAVKMLTKEDITPFGADKLIYNLAPIIAFATRRAAVGGYSFHPAANRLRI